MLDVANVSVPVSDMALARSKELAAACSVVGRHRQRAVAERRIVADAERAGTDGGAAEIGVGAAKDELPGAVLDHRAVARRFGAGDDVVQRHGAGLVERNAAGVEGDVAGERAGGAVVEIEKVAAAAEDDGVGIADPALAALDAAAVDDGEVGAGDGRAVRALVGGAARDRAGVVDREGGTVDASPAKLSPTMPAAPPVIEPELVMVTLEATRPAPPVPPPPLLPNRAWPPVIVPELVKVVTDPVSRTPTSPVPLLPGSPLNLTPRGPPVLPAPPAPPAPPVTVNVFVTE